MAERKQKPRVPPLKKSMTTLHKPKKPAEIGVKIKPKAFLMACGTPNQLGSPRKFLTEKDAKKAAIEFVNGYMPMFSRISAAAVGELDNCISDIQGLPSLLREHRVVERLIDSYSGLRISIHLWREGDG